LQSRSARGEKEGVFAGSRYRIEPIVSDVEAASRRCRLAIKTNQAGSPGENKKAANLAKEIRSPIAKNASGAILLTFVSYRISQTPDKTSFWRINSLPYD
jgi:hypothetical protein